MSELPGEVRDVTVEGSTIRCHVDGPEDARPIVLVHGAGADAAGMSWKAVFPALAGSHRVYAMDLPGYGESDRVPRDTPPTIDFYVARLDSLLAELGVVDATLVGISKGGAISLGYTLAHGERVSRLVLLDSYGLGDHVPGGRSTAVAVRIPKFMELSWWATTRSRRLLRASLAGVVHEANLTEELVDDAQREVRRPDAGDAYIRFARAEMHLSGPRTNYEHRLGDLPVPTLFVHGEDDPLVPPSLSKRAADRAPVADLFTLEQCGHWTSREHPEVLVSRLEAWLDKGL